MIGVPDYGHGGMENWGLVTYPESGLFYDPDVDTRSTKESMLTVIAHEIAHQVCLSYYSISLKLRSILFLKHSDEEGSIVGT